MQTNSSEGSTNPSHLLPNSPTPASLSASRQFVYIPTGLAIADIVVRYITTRDLFRFASCPVLSPRSETAVSPHRKRLGESSLQYRTWHTQWVGRSCQERRSIVCTPTGDENDNIAQAAPGGKCVSKPGRLARDRHPLRSKHKALPVRRPNQMPFIWLFHSRGDMSSGVRSGSR